MTPPTESLLLLGVAHTRANVRPVKAILKSTSLKGKLVFTEGDDRPGKSDQEFFKPIMTFLLAQGAVILHEIGEIELTRQAMAEYRPIYEEQFAEKIRLAEKFFAPIEDTAQLKKEAHDTFMVILGRHRDPNILKLLLNSNPDVAIMGDKHAERIYPELQARLDRPIDYQQFL